MEKCVIASIGPEWCHKILLREKLYEVRKTHPNLPTPFRCLIYCTKHKRRMIVQGAKWFLDNLYRLPDGECKIGCAFELENEYDGVTEDNYLNGKVIAEFICDEILEYHRRENPVFWGYQIPTHIQRQTGLDSEQIDTYGNKKPLYLWHISGLKIYEKPKSLEEIGLKAAPQSWRYVEV